MQGFCPLHRKNYAYKAKKDEETNKKIYVVRCKIMGDKFTEKLR